MRGERDDDLTDLAAMIDGGGGLSRRTWRLAAWAGATVIALALFAAAVTSETGSQRLAALAGARPTGAPKTASRTLDMELELRRMSETVRTLTIDRDRLQSRLSMLERNLDEATVTGSIPPHPARALGTSAGPPGASAASAGTAPPQATVPALARPAPEPAESAASPPGGAQPAAAVAEPKVPFAPESSPPRPRAAAPSSSTEGAPGAYAGRGAPAAAPSSETMLIKTEFGIDVGGDQSIEGLRNTWAMLRGSHPALFENLRPVVSVRDGQKPGALELRLVAGPLANASVAARYCAVLAGSGLACQPAVFDGQRLALR